MTEKLINIMKNIAKVWSNLNAGSYQVVTFQSLQPGGPLKQEPRSYYCAHIYWVLILIKLYHVCLNQRHKGKKTGFRKFIVKLKSFSQIRLPFPSLWGLLTTLMTNLPYAISIENVFFYHFGHLWPKWHFSN